jgi:hypothetical protein
MNMVWMISIAGGSRQLYSEMLSVFAPFMHNPIALNAITTGRCDYRNLTESSRRFGVET